MNSNFFSFLFLINTLLLFPQATHAQFGKFEMGFSAGFAHNKLHTTAIRDLSTYDAKIGFGVSVHTQYFVKNWLAVELDLSCIQKNYAWKHATFANQTTKNTYIQLPAMLRFSLGKKQFKLFANAGGFGGCLVNRRVSGAVFNVFNMETPYSYDEKSELDKRRDRRIELGLVVGLGLEYFLNNQYRLFVEARYLYGATDLQKKNYMLNQIPRYNDTFLFQAGCLFNLSNIKNKKIKNNEK